MRKTLKASLMALIGILMITGNALAGTAMLPEGAKVSATVNGGQVQVTVTGVKVAAFELYSYEGVKQLGTSGTYTWKLRDGKRFNFKFQGKDGVAYVLLTPEMSTDIDFLGPGVGIDSHSPDSQRLGSCFEVL